MKFDLKNKTTVIASILVLLIAVSIILLAIINPFKQVEYEKWEIQEHINGAAENSSFDHVSDYLRDWGMPTFDKTKLNYFDDCCNQLYNFGDGIPDTFTHAKLTASLFLENQYDNIDKDNKTAVTDAILTCYITVLGDPYSIYRQPEETEIYTEDMSGKFGGIGVMVEYIDQDESIMVNTVYPGSPAEKAGIKVGDFIYGIDGKTVDELGYRNAVNYVRGKIGTDVELTLLRGDKQVTVVATRAEIEELNVVYKINEENNTGYVQIVAFKQNTFDQFKEAIDTLEAAKVRGIIFDLRNNPGGYVDSVLAVISYLIPDGKTVMSYQYKDRDRVVLVSDDDEGDHVVNLPFVVLCNQYTASAGEIFTAAIRDYRNEGIMDATIVGTTTYKKGIMQNTYYYPLDQSTVTLTVAYYNPPCGVNYHGIGVTPDVQVENTETEDLQYDAAVIELEKLINDN